MRKIYLFAASIILPIFIFGPFFIGQRLEKLYPEYLARVSKAQDIQFELTQYKRGYFQSQASLRMKVPNAQSQTSPHIIELNQMIHHGPLLFSRLGRHLDININPAIIYTSLAGDLGKKTHALWNHQEPALITTLINWKTKATTKVKTQPLTQTIHDKFIELSKTEIQISHDLNFNNMYGSIIVPKLHIKDEQDLTIHHLNLRWQGNLHSFIDIKDARLLLADIILKRREQTVLYLQGLDIDLNKNQKNMDTCNLTLSGGIMHGQIYGEEYPFSQGSVEFVNISNNFIQQMKAIPIHATLDTVTPQILNLLTNSNTKLLVNLPKKVTAGLTTFFSYEAYQRHLNFEHRLGHHTLDLKPMFQHQTMAFLAKLVENKTLKETVTSYHMDLSFMPANQIVLNGQILNPSFLTSKQDN